MPLANTEGGLAISLYRGARAVGESGGFRTHVAPRPHDPRVAPSSSRRRAGASPSPRWVEGQVREMQAWLASAPVEGLSRFAKLREIETHVVGPMCHVMYAYTTGDAVGLNMVTRNWYALNQAFVLDRAPVEPSRRCSRGTWAATRRARIATSSAAATARR